MRGFKIDKKFELLESKTALIIPIYNEAKVLENLVKKLIKTKFELYLINDGSNDNTKKILMKYQNKIHYVEHLKNLGQGAALRTGLEVSKLNNKIDFFITFDSDGQHKIKDIFKFIKAAQDPNIDIILGSRFLNKKNQKDIPYFKRKILKLSVYYIRIFYKLNLTDSHNGLRLIKRRVVDLFVFEEFGMSHATEILEIIARKKLTYQEVPVEINYSEYSIKKGQNALDIFNHIIRILLK